MTTYLFTFEDYYPRGGAQDLAGIYETVEQAKVAADALTTRRDAGMNQQICDFEAGVVLCRDRDNEAEPWSEWEPAWFIKDDRASRGVSRGVYWRR